MIFISFITNVLQFNTFHKNLICCWSALLLTSAKKIIGVWIFERITFNGFQARSYFLAWKPLKIYFRLLTDYFSSTEVKQHHISVNILYRKHFWQNAISFKIFAPFYDYNHNPARVKFSSHLMDNLQPTPRIPDWRFSYIFASCL